MTRPETDSPSSTPPLEVVLKPTSGWLDLDLAGLWQYRYLLQLLVWRDFASKYKQTILGPIWFILQPLMMTLVFTGLFGHVAKLSTDGLPPFLFYLGGLLAWNYFAANFQSNSATLVNHAGLFSKVYFPRLIVPLAALASNAFTFLVQATIFGCLFVTTKLAHPAAAFGGGWKALLLPLVLLHIAVLSFGVGLLLSSLTAKYRDLTHVAPLMIQLWMYATPVILPLSDFPARWRWAVVLNPMATAVESMRLILLGSGTVEPLHLAYSIGISLFLVATGLLAFSRVEKTFVDSV